jgi:hypothetical protein
MHRDFTFVRWVKARVTTWTDPSAEPGRRHRYQVRAQNEVGSNSLPSPLLSVRVFDDVGLPEFGAPDGVTVSVGEDGEALVSWQPVADAEHYVVHRDGVYVGWVGFGASTFSDPAPIADADHAYVVRAKDADGRYSAPSASATPIG